jgi:hypothetical protein
MVNEYEYVTVPVKDCLFPAQGQSAHPREVKKIRLMER